MKLKAFIKKNVVFIFPILSGVLLILAYPPYDLEFLTWIALIPLFWFLFLEQTSLKKALIGGSLAGAIFFGKLFSWLFATAPFEWLGVTIRANVLIVFIALIILWIIQSIFLGLFIGFFAWTIKKVVKLNLVSLVTIPAFWIIFEYLRAWGFGILWLGKEGLLGPHWTFGNLAYTLHNKLALIQIADIGGIYIISFLIVLTNTIFFLIFKYLKEKSMSRNRLVILFVLLCLVATLWTGYGIYKLKTEESPPKAGLPRAEKIALLQTNFSSANEFNPYQKKDVFKNVLNLFKSPEAISKEPDIIIAPEGFGILSLTGDNEIAKYLLKDFWRPGQIFLENQKIIEENGLIKSRLFYYDLEKEKPVTSYDKTLLVPNGEYLPYLTNGLLSIYSFNINYGQRFYQKGEKVEPAKTSKGNIGGTICSSIVSPELQRKMTKKGAELLVVVSSDAPFHGSKTLLAQNLAMSKLRAVENRRYFAQATNMGYSFLLNPKGEVTEKSSELENKILFSSINLLNQKTIYTRLGDWVVLLSFLILFLAIAIQKRSYPHSS